MLRERVCVRVAWFLSGLAAMVLASVVAIDCGSDDGGAGDSRRVWFPTSTAVLAQVGEAANDQVVYEKDRSELDSTQLAALEQLRIISSSDDGGTATATATQNAGSPAATG